MSTSVFSTACSGLSAEPGQTQMTARRLKTDKSLFNAALLGVTLLLGGCASLGNNGNKAVDISPMVSAAMADDLVGVARQIFIPVNTTLQFNDTGDDPVLTHFIRDFASAGYGIQRVSADQGSNFFTYKLSEQGADKPVRLSATIGAVEMSRDYIVSSAESVSPVSPFWLSGTSEAVVIENKRAGALTATSDELAKAVYVASLDLDSQAPPVITLITEDLVTRVATQGSRATNSQAFNFTPGTAENLFESGESIFSSILDDYEQIDKQVIVFGDDSIVLGNVNKSLIKQWVSNLEPNDLVSLIGCSHGPTALEVGNEGLALNRANRVTQALMEEGVARDRILDQGCWAAEQAADFPARGVVLELWRDA